MVVLTAALETIPTTAVPGQIIAVKSFDFSPATKDAPGPFGNHQIAGDAKSGISLGGKRLGRSQLVYPVDLDVKGWLFTPLEVPVNDMTLEGGPFGITVTDTGGRTGIGTLNLKTPRLTVSPITSTRGSLVKVTGEGFVAGSWNKPSRYLIDIEYAGRRIATTETDPSGAFEVSFRVPSDTAIESTNFVSAKVRLLASEAMAFHKVPDASIAVEPQRAPLGGKATITGTGFPAFQRVWIKVGTTWALLSGVTTDVNGAFTTTISIPEETPLGEQMVLANTPSLSREGTVTTTRR
jgi:hypothetical protein